MTKNEKDKVALYLGRSILEHQSKIFEFNPVKFFGKGSTMQFVGEASDTLLRVATGSQLESWFEVFLHETSHLDQQKERPRWFNHRLTKVYIFQEFLDGRGEISKNDLKSILELEHDCDTRSLRKIVGNQLPINLGNYTKKTNQYLMGYVKAFKTGFWEKEKNGSWKKHNSKLIPLKEIYQML